MEYNCPRCGKAFEITESGFYKCDQCGDLFQFVAEEAKPEITIPAERLASSLCPMCKGIIPHGAKKCQHCGSWIGEKPPSVLVYVLLWLFIPTAVLGVPEFYAGRNASGFCLFLFSLCSWFLIASKKHPEGSLPLFLLFYLVCFFVGLILTKEQSKC